MIESESGDGDIEDGGRFAGDEVRGHDFLEQADSRAGGSVLARRLVRPVKNALHGTVRGILNRSHDVLGMALLARLASADKRGAVLVLGRLLQTDSEVNH